VFNTLNGDSNVAFFKKYRNAGLAAAAMPVVSIAEEEVGGIGVDNPVGQLTAWNYYQIINSPANNSFVRAFKAKYGQGRVTSRPDGGRVYLTVSLFLGRRWWRKRSRS
jgi:urea transport system substrate-binding protein